MSNMTWPIENLAPFQLRVHFKYACIFKKLAAHQIFIAMDLYMVQTADILMILSL